MTEVFLDSQLDAWPSIPNENKKVPALADVIQYGGGSGKAAEALKLFCEAEKKESDNIEYQAVMQSQFGLFTIPGMIQLRNSKDFVAYYSNCGAWNDESFNRLLQWVIYLSSCDFVHNLKVKICEEQPPLKAREIISSKQAHRMMISLIPHLVKTEQCKNARVFSECFAFNCNSKKLLNYDEVSLQLVENWYTQEVKSTTRDSFYFSFFVRTIGSFLGQVLCDQFKGEWDEGEWPCVKILKGKSIMKVAVFSLASDYVVHPHVKTSLVNHFHLVRQEFQ